MKIKQYLILLAYSIVCYGQEEIIQEEIMERRCLEISHSRHLDDYTQLIAKSSKAVLTMQDIQSIDLIAQQLVYSAEDNIKKSAAPLLFTVCKQNIHLSPYPLYLLSFTLRMDETLARDVILTYAKCADTSVTSLQFKKTLEIKFQNLIYQLILADFSVNDSTVDHVFHQPNLFSYIENNLQSIDLFRITPKLFAEYPNETLEKLPSWIGDPEELKAMYQNHFLKYIEGISVHGKVPQVSSLDKAIRYFGMSFDLPTIFPDLLNKYPYETLDHVTQWIGDHEELKSNIRLLCLDYLDLNIDHSISITSVLSKIIKNFEFEPDFFMDYALEHLNNQGSITSIIAVSTYYLQSNIISENLLAACLMQKSINMDIPNFIELASFASSQIPSSLPELLEMYLNHATRPIVYLYESVLHSDLQEHQQLIKFLGLDCEPQSTYLCRLVKDILDISCDRTLFRKYMPERWNVYPDLEIGAKKQKYFIYELRKIKYKILGNKNLLTSFVIKLRNIGLLDPFTTMLDKFQEFDACNEVKKFSDMLKKADAIIFNKKMMPQDICSKIIEFLI